MYRSIRLWLNLIREAVEYGLTHQLIHGEEPVLETLTDYESWKPKGKLNKRLVELRVDQLFDITKVQPFTNIVTSIADWNCIRMAGDKRIGENHLRIYGDAMNVSGQIARVSTTWDVVNQRAVEWAAKNTNKLVTLVTEETKEALRQTIARGIAEGQSIPQVARRIRATEGVGLNARQMGALNKFEDKLLDKYSGMKGGLTPARSAKAAQQVARESRRKLKYRSEMIARTETSRAISEGTLAGYEEADVKRIRFEASADACLECSFLDGNEYSILEGEGMIPLHPNCRCTWVPVHRGEVVPKKPEVMEIEGNPTIANGKKFTKADGDAIMRYTGMDYTEINAAQLDKPWKDWYSMSKERALKKASMIEKALLKMPGYQGTSYRGLRFDSTGEQSIFLKQMKSRVGHTYKFGSFQSSSSDKILGSYFTGSSGGRVGGVLLEIEGKTGRKIVEFSRHKGEAEVLFMKNSAFNVTKVVGNKVYLTEL